MSPDHSADRLNRLVQLVAEGSRHAWECADGVPLDRLADQLGVDRSQLLEDVRLLTEAGDHPDTTWLSSLTASQEGDRLTIESRGQYRRPIRFTAHELLALRIALATETTRPSPVLAALAKWERASGRDGAPPVSPVPVLGGSEPAMVDLARAAMDRMHKLALVYAGEGAAEATTRVIHVHDVVLAEGTAYLVAWCELRRDWRRFRCDRILEAHWMDETFERRDDAPVTATRRDLFVPPEGDKADEVTVRFSKDVARWVRERYQVEERADGSVVVTVRTASVDWLVRMVLHYGDAAEVLDPPAYREAMRRAVAAA